MIFWLLHFQIVTSVNNADESALVIIDEFGKGTSAVSLGPMKCLYFVLYVMRSQSNKLFYYYYVIKDRLVTGKTENG